MRGFQLGFAVVLFISASLLSAQTTEIEVLNRTGQPLQFLFISSSASDSWGGDLLGTRVLADQERIIVRLRSNAPPFDVRALDANDTEYLIWDWHSDTGSLVIDGRSARESRAPQGSDDRGVLAWIDVVNDTSYTLDRAFAVRSGDSFDQESAVPNLLDSRLPIRPGERYRLPLDESLVGSPIDLLLIDADGDRYLKERIDLQIATETQITLEDLSWM